MSMKKNIDDIAEEIKRSVEEYGSIEVDFTREYYIEAGPAVYILLRDDPTLSTEIQYYSTIYGGRCPTCRSNDCDCCIITCEKRNVKEI